MAKRNRNKQGFGGPAVKTGGSLGPALNPIGMAQTGPGQRYLDATVAFEAEKENTPWNRFWRDEKATAKFSRPVMPRSQS